MSSGVRIERFGAVARLTLNRPEHGNAIDAAMASGLLSAAAQVDNEADVRCVVLTGAGHMFCTGGDVGGFAAAGADAPRLVTEQTAIFHGAIARLARMDKPLVVAVNGPAAGAGLSLAALGDLVLAAPEAHFTFGYTALGFAPDGGATWLLPRVIGLRRTQELALTNRRIAADEAVAIGLATRLATGDVLGEVMDLAHALAKGPTRAIGRTRALLMQSFANGLETQMELEARALASSSGEPDGREGVAAFLQRRLPVFGN